MLDVDTFITTLYVMVDDFCQSQAWKATNRPGPQASLTRSEVVTLSLFGQWVNFPSERAFYPYAQEHLRAAFPSLPARSQFNRRMQRPSPPLACIWSSLPMPSTATMSASNPSSLWLYDSGPSITDHAQRFGRICHRSRACPPVGS